MMGRRGSHLLGGGVTEELQVGIAQQPPGDTQPQAERAQHLAGQGPNDEWG